MKKFKSFEEEHEILMNIYDNIKNENNNLSLNNIDIKNENNNINELNGIKKGDIIIFKHNKDELNGEVLNFINEKYLVKINNILKENIEISFEQILEHYPKNNNFNDDKNENEDKIKEDLLIEPKTSNQKNNFVITFPDEMKQKEIDKLLPNYTEAKYFIVEKNNELHIVKIKNGFEIKPFVENLINHIISKKLIKENISKMKVIGNGKFCIIKNSSIKMNEMLKNLLKDLLK